jgi:antitoxin HicB
MKYTFKVHKEKTGYWAECLELDGCQTQGDTLEELNKNMDEALDLYLSEPADSEVIFPFPGRKKKTGKNIIAVQVNPRTALAMMVRQARVLRKKTQREMTLFLGFKSLSSYQRFEDPETANPELDTLSFLKEKMPELKLELIWG